MIEKTCYSRFSLHKFVHLKCFWTQYKNVHLRGLCSLRPCILRPYCNILFILAKNSKILGQKCCLDHSSVDGNGNRKFLCGKIPFVWTRKGRKEPLDWRLVMFFRQFLHQFFPRTFRTQTLRSTVLDVLWGQQIKFIQVVSTSEFHEY